MSIHKYSLADPDPFGSELEKEFLRKIKSINFFFIYLKVFKVLKEKK